jgi:hypothetical protein
MIVQLILFARNILSMDVSYFQYKKSIDKNLTSA